MSDLVKICPVKFCPFPLRPHEHNPRTAAELAEHCIVASNEASHLDAIPDELDALMCLNCADAYARQQVEAAVKEVQWLDEFVVEPEWFPNEGDRQYWQERRAAIRALRGT